MYFSQILDYYSRDDVQQKIMEVSRNREVAGVFSSGAFSQRPGSLQYPADITSVVNNGALELHCSIEHWSQPMALKTDNYDQLRIGWDFIADIDCNDFRHGRAATIVFCKALEEHGIRGYSVKFTGGTGFHVGVPWISIPKKVDYKHSAKMFPELPRAMCMYLKEYCRDSMEKALMKLDSIDNLAKQGDVKLGELTTGDGINPFKLADIDAVLISPRHLFRMPYSLNMKSMLASLPVAHSDVASFERSNADIKKFKATLGFLDSGVEDEAGALVAEAMDWYRKTKKKQELHGPKKIVEFNVAVGPENFPPCIKRILEGLGDGRKRALFILINFLSSVGWKWDAIEQAIFEWNAKNTQQLPENYIRTHLRWSSNRQGAQGKKMMPPGCTNEGWYESIGVCSPDATCGGPAKTVKNPVNYPIRKLGATNRNREKQDRRRRPRKTQA